MAEAAPAMLWVVVLFLGLSLLLYCLFGGADFGAGILEIFFLGRPEHAARRRVIDKALGPVWEANHIWLILLVVILFMGFPKVYAQVSTSLHLPLTAMLMGIIARGTSFTFRHYDAVRGSSQRLYTGFFVMSSLWTPFWLGVVAGALIPGGIDPAPRDYHSGYIGPWLRPFPLALGVFTDALFAFLAAVYLVGESAGKDRAAFARMARMGSAATVAAGAAVFAAAEADGLKLAARFLEPGIPSACMALATLAFPALWLALRKESVWLARALAGGQVALVLAGWFRVQYPVLVRLSGGGELTFFNTRAPDAALFQLGIALIGGAALILPALFYLLRVFKAETGAGKP